MISKKMYEAIFYISEKINKIISVFVIIAVLSFSFLIFISVVTRYVFNYSILFSVEISKLLFVWSCFLAATVAYKDNYHIRFEFITKKIGHKGVYHTNNIIQCASILFFSILFINSISFTRIVWTTIMPVSGFSQGWLYVPVIVSSAVFIIHSIRLLLGNVISASLNEAGQ